MSKNLIDVGIAGDNTTGDTLFAGGTKINSMFSEVYDAFGKQGANPQDIHAAGYYQTPAAAYFSFPVKPGACLNVDTRNGSRTVKLPNGKIGEMVKLRDVYGSWANSPVTVSADGVEKIDGSVVPVVFGLNFLDITFVCIDDSPGSVNWTYHASKLDSRDIRVIDRIFILTPSTPVTYTIASVDQFTSLKLLVTGLQQSGGTAVTSSEIHLAQDGTTHVYTESAVLSTGSSRVYDIDFSLQSGNVLMTLSTTLTQAKVHVRSTDFTKIDV